MEEIESDFLNIKKRYSLNHLPFIEYIWGHRFRTDQTPMILLFELMCIIENQYEAKKAGFIKNIFSPDNDTLFLNHRRNFKLRILLYQNEMLETIYHSSMSDDEKWEKQFNFLMHLKNDHFKFEESDIEHIKGNFTTFESFYNVISIVSSLTFEPLSNKRWTSKFVFPISREYIWCDYDNVKGSEDRRFFSRGGELIYLMLCRSPYEIRLELESKFIEWVEDEGDSYSKLAQLLVVQEQRLPLEENKRKKLGYLHYDKMNCFNLLAEDIVGTLKLSLEKLDKVKILADMVGYHAGNYILTIGEMYCASTDNISEHSPHYVAEVLSKGTNSIRKTSIQSMSTQKNKLKRTLNNRIPGLFDLYADESWDKTEKERTLNEETKSAENYLADHIIGYPHVCFRAIGFVSRKNTRSYRYVITEDFLHSLVMSILGTKKRLELRKFVRALQLRYNIFIDQAPDHGYDILQSDLNRNSKNLAILLYQMGMLRHLSDACSYVVNPYLEDAL
jgi:hypothetical protein